VKTSEFFDTEAAQWSDRYALDARFRRRFDKVTGLLERVGTVSPGRALDVGCGTGIFSNYLARKGWRVTAIDASPDMIEAANAVPESDTIEFINVNYESYSSLPNSFDLIVSLSMLEYIEDDEAAIEKFHQLLKPGGFLVVSVPNKAGMLRKMEGVVFGIQTATRDRIFGGMGEYLKFQKRQYTPFELDILMRQFGFRKKRGMFLNGGITKPEWMLPIFERRWWAAMYCAVYEKK
jgi:2-polyprenyl-6-hydroxyphenyl methylase/3-demethylubiquinone-9 3-methyltransferase